MLAIIYLFIMFILGDSICRRYYPFLSTAHRLAAAFLCGLLISSWWTYLSALLFYGTSSPMLWGNLVFFITSIGAIYLLRRRRGSADLQEEVDRTATEFEKWDWIVTGIFLVVACWMMFATFGMEEGKMLFGHHEASDFGSTVSIMESFARGNNFPTEFPHFSGDRMRYHFLFYFQAGNLQYLGLSPAFGNNILSILSLVSMLILVMTLGAAVFGSRVVGRIGAALFFFHGSLSFIPFITSIGFVSGVVSKLFETQDFLPSGYQYRGETWGIWSQVVFVNQRHLASSIGLFLLVLVFLCVRYRIAVDRARALKNERDIKQGSGLNEISDSIDSEIPPSAGEQNAPEDSETGEEVVSVNDSQDGEIPAAEESSLVADTKTQGEGASITDSHDSQNIEIPASADESSSVVHSETDVEVASINDPLDSPDHDITASVEESSSAAEREKEVASTSSPDRGTYFDAGESTEIDDIEKEAEVIEPGKTLSEWVSEGMVGVIPFVFCGILLGLMPMWNGAVFTAAFAVLAMLFLLFPLRRQMVLMGFVTAIVALPQIYFLKTGGLADPGYSLLHWGYTLGPDATILQVLQYLGWTFGFKLVLIAIALVVGTWFQRRLMIAILSLIVLTFCFQFSLEVLTNHKFLNIWLIIANLYGALGLEFLWNLRILKTVLIGRIAALVLALLVTVGGFIDLFPIHNSFWVAVPYSNDPLVNWITHNTDPKAVFLSERYVNHAILGTGRRLFYGHPYYAWSAGYDTATRDAVYREMLESKDIAKVFRLLKQNNISYVAIDNSLRKGQGFVKNSNESVLSTYLPTVFSDDDHRYDDLRIFEVPDVLPEGAPAVETPPELTFTNAFESRVGDTPGSFSKPRGIAADSRGYFYVSDTDNARVQKFDADGKFAGAIGTPGAFEGEIKEPNGVAVDQSGDIYVTDSANHKLIKFSPDGKFLKEWKGPDSGFYGPRDIAFGPNKQLYIVDQGRTRIARFDPETESFSLVWGTPGSGEGQFNEPTGIVIGGDLVFVTDFGNSRIQVFDLDGRFVRQWEVPVWEKTSGQYPDAVYDEPSKRVYVTSGRTNEILSFDLNGNRLDDIALQGGERLDNPSSLSILEANKKRWLLILNTGSSKVSRFELEAKKGK